MKQLTVTFHIYVTYYLSMFSQFLLTRNKVINYCKNRKIALVIISHNIEIKEIEVKKYKLIKEKDNIILREE